MNHPQMCLMISDQDKDLFMYVIDLEVSEGGWGQVDGENEHVSLGGGVGCGRIILSMHVQCECLAKRSRRC